MTWVFVLILASVAFALVVWWRRAPRPTWEAIGAALILGLAGYALQGHPGLRGQPSDASAIVPENPSILVDLRQKVTNSGIPTTNRWIVLSDAMARNGEFASAAGVLRGAVEDDPKDSEAWLALANALVMHAHGVATPAALYAYRQAAVADPKAPGPPFFLGLMLATAGRLPEARQVWADLLAHAPTDAPWRNLVKEQLALVNRAISAQSAAEPGT